jgi:hypothetical protein
MEQWDHEEWRLTSTRREASWQIPRKHGCLVPIFRWGTTSVQVVVDGRKMNGMTAVHLHAPMFRFYFVCHNPFSNLNHPVVRVLMARSVRL